MDIREALTELGGVARRPDLLTAFTWREIAAAVESGAITRCGHATYALGHIVNAQQLACEMRGRLACLSAAEALGWQVARKSDRPWIAVPRNRKVLAAQRSKAHVIYRDEPDASPVGIVLDCARALPFGEALAVADSALRAGTDADELRTAAAKMRGPGARAVRRVADHATPLAGSPLESVLRSICLDIRYLDVEPQEAIELPGFTVHPDPVDRGLHLVIEADTWSNHGREPTAFNRDMRRYTLLASLGWTILRFNWQDVMETPDDVAEIVTRTVRILTSRMLSA